MHWCIVNFGSKREMSETMPIVIVMIAVAVLFGALGLAYERQKRDERRQWAESTGDDGNRSEACAILRYPLPGPF